jgi:prepilin-type processing-associated H-X9-DG protein
VAFVTGDVSSSGSSSWDPSVDVAVSPLMPFIGKNFAIWHCPSDSVMVSSPSGQVSRPRSISMSQVFDNGRYLPDSSYQTYWKETQIVVPAQTFVFIDENPDSINDGAFAVQMADPGATSATIVDYPSSSHGGSGGLSFADGHSEIHHWLGSKIKRQVTGRHMVQSEYSVPAGDSVNDMIWLSSNTTVHN